MYQILPVKAVRISENRGRFFERDTVLFGNCRWPSGCPRKTFIVYTRIALVKPLFSGKAQRCFERVAPMSPEAEGWRRAGRPDGGFSLQPSLRGCDRVSTRCNRAGDTAWVPRCSAGRTAGSAGLRRRNAQLRWAMRGQDPLKEQRVPRRTSG